MDARRAEAFALLKVGKHAEALPILEGILHDDLADAVVLETLGDVREKLGDTEGALSAYAGAVVHLRTKGATDRALSVLELMQVLAPTNPWTRAEAAGAFAERGDAVSTWREIGEAASVWIESGDIEKTLDLCQRHEDLLPSDLAGPLLVVERLTRARQRRAAARLAVSLGHALRQKKRIIPALELYGRAVALDARCREAHHARVGGLLALGQLDDAHAAALRAVDADGRDIVALTLLERVCAARGDDTGVAVARRRISEASALRDAPRTASGASVHEDAQDSDGSSADTREDTASGDAIVEVDSGADVRTDLDE